MLKFVNPWRYESAVEGSSGVINEFFDIVAKMARGEKDVLEHFKQYFATAAGEFIIEVLEQTGY